MSGSRRTEDFNTVKTRQLILINPDGSFPAQGQLIGVTNSRGALGPTTNPVFGTITANNINVVNYPNYQDISAVTIQADNITTNTLDITNNGRLTVYDLCANRIETWYLTAMDISADCIHCDTIFPRQIGSVARPVDVIDAVQVNAMDLEASVSVETPYLNVTSQLDAQDISANFIDAEKITTVTLALNKITQAESITTVALNAVTSNINGLNVNGTANISNLVSTVINATNIVATNATVTGNLTTSGTFNPANINTTGTMTANRIVAVNDISAASINARTATFDILNAQLIDISGINYDNLVAKTLTCTSSIKDAGTLDVSGATTLRGVTATTLTVAGLTTTNNMSAITQISAPTINATGVLNVGTFTPSAPSQITMYDTKPANIGSVQNPGILTYDVSNGLLLNGLLVSTTAAFGRTQPFSLVTATNNLATVTDISATMFDLLNSYNAFLTLFSNAKLMIQLTPVVNFLSPCSIQFVINNVTQPPLILFGKYTLGATNAGTTTLMTILTAAALDVIKFTATPDVNNVWRVTISMPTGTNNYISDITGMPTGSLQVLRYMGFNVPISPAGANPYETYAPSGSTYTRTSTPLNAPYLATGDSVPQLIQYTNNLPDISFNVSGDPYSLPIRFTNLVSSTATQYLAIKYNSAYNLYAKTIAPIPFLGLAPNTGYDFTFNYLDLSNNSSVSPRLFTTKIPAPSDISANTNDISFNSFILRWSQPYPGRTYTFTLDASGQFITSPLIGVQSPITFYPLVQNTQYRVTVTSFDPSYPTKPSDPSLPITVTTKPLTVPTPVITAVPNSNITALVNWTTPVTAGARGTLNYNVNSGAAKVYNIPGNATSFTILDLLGTGDISGSLVYTDNNYNTIRSQTATYRYDTSFGFYDMSAIDMSSSSVITLNNTTLNGVGYVLPATLKPPAPIRPNPWVGYTFNRISFPKGIRESSGNLVSFRANVYTVPAADMSGLYNAPYIVNPFDLSSGVVPTPPPYSPAISSNTVTLDASSTPYMRYPTLNFSSPVLFTQNTMLMFEIVSGSGTIQFSTFLYSIAIAKSAYATSIAYNRTTRTLSNWSANVFSSVICQFSYA